MPTADSVKTKIQGLIDSVNAATGQADADMTTAVATLISGYGASNDTGAKFYTGTYVPEERLLHNVEFSTPGGVTHFAMFLFEEPVFDTGKSFGVAVIGSKGGRQIGTGSNNAGTAVTAGVCYDNEVENTSLYYDVEFGADSVTVVAPTGTEKYIRALLANKTYIWVAW